MEKHRERTPPLDFFHSRELFFFLRCIFHSFTTPSPTPSYHPPQNVHTLHSGALGTCERYFCSHRTKSTFFPAVLMLPFAAFRPCKSAVGDTNTDVGHPLRRATDMSALQGGNGWGMEKKQLKLERKSLTLHVCESFFYPVPREATGCYQEWVVGREAHRLYCVCVCARNVERKDE